MITVKLEGIWNEAVMAYLKALSQQAVKVFHTEQVSSLVS
jgi:hypothetical protein